MNAANRNTRPSNTQIIADNFFICSILTDQFQKKSHINDTKRKNPNINSRLRFSTTSDGELFIQFKTPARSKARTKACKKRHEACGILGMQQNLFTEERVELHVIDWLSKSGFDLIKQNW